MKIALLGSKDFDSLEYHLNESLSFLGNFVIHIDIKDAIAVPYKYNYMASKFLKKYDEFLFRKVAKKIIESDPELVICTYRFINPICIRLIKQALPKVKVIHINPDQLTTLEYQQIFASPYDAYFTKDHYMVDFMKNKMGLNTFYLPEAFNPRVHIKPQVDRVELEHKLGIDLLSFGTMYPYRANMVAKLIESNINVSLFGSMDRRFFRDDLKLKFNSEFITGQRKSELVYGSKIIFNNFHYAEIESANVKFFEIGGIGGFQICDYKSSLKEYSSIPVEDFTYKNINEAIDLINFYLDKPLLRHELSLKQYEYFLLNHTYEHRIDQLMRLIY
ncbi:CgeB family protein [Flavobacterium hydatis]|uniref:Glycosyltransferase n=1 Tax=Flavobacterium hydatis TaxID=991 RepID=A0A086ANL3_FLAHY|nr:glycosyltransferase [Flavobacterium hydatis]KFF18277.1 glycosyltransferase [Flavobacterium hydatis]OXA96974.1 glycosyltransferase [Flavobacterium hydatis]